MFHEGRVAVLPSIDMVQKLWTNQIYGGSDIGVCVVLRRANSRAVQYSWGDCACVPASDQIAINDVVLRRQRRNAKVRVKQRLSQNGLIDLEWDLLERGFPTGQKRIALRLLFEADNTAVILWKCRGDWLGVTHQSVAADVQALIMCQRDVKSIKHVKYVRNRGKHKQIAV